VTNRGCSTVMECFANSVASLDDGVMRMTFAGGTAQENNLP
jgi:hypothetical protein